jgi:hypothetical protein
MLKYLRDGFWAVLQCLWPASLSAVVIRAVGSGGFFCFSPVIACLFFVAGVVCVGDASVTLPHSTPFLY